MFLSTKFICADVCMYTVQGSHVKSLLFFFYLKKKERIHKRINILILKLYNIKADSDPLTYPSRFCQDINTRVIF